MTTYPPTEGEIVQLVLDLNEFAVEANLTAPELVKLAFFVHSYGQNLLAKDPRRVSVVADDLYAAQPEYYRQHKIVFIKDLRNATGLGLKDSKDAVEDCLRRHPVILARAGQMWHGLSIPAYEEPPF